MKSAKGVPITLNGAMPARGFRISACRFPDRPNTWPSWGPLGRGTSISPEILLPSNRCGQAASESCHFPTLAGYIRARRTAEAIDLDPLRRVADSYTDPKRPCGKAPRHFRAHGNSGCGAHFSTFQRAHSVVWRPGVFKIRSTESIVFQLRVVAGAPKSSSIRPR